MAFNDRPALFIGNALEGATVTATEEIVDYEPSNVLDPRHDRVWQSETGAATLQFELTGAVDLQGFLLRIPTERDPVLNESTRVDAGDTVTIRAYDVKGGALQATKVVTIALHKRLGYIPIVFFDGSSDLETINGAYWELEFSVAAGWFEIENVEANVFFVPEQNVRERNIFGTLDTSDKARSEYSGGLFALTKSRLMTFAGDWSVWGDSEQRAWRLLFLDLGTTRRFSFFRKLTGDLTLEAMICTIEAQELLLVSETDRHHVARLELLEAR